MFTCRTTILVMAADDAHAYAMTLAPLRLLASHTLLSKTACSLQFTCFAPLQGKDFEGQLAAVQAEFTSFKAAAAEQQAQLETKLKAARDATAAAEKDNRLFVARTQKVCTVQHFARLLECIHVCCCCACWAVAR